MMLNNTFPPTHPRKLNSAKREKDRHTVALSEVQLLKCLSPSLIHVTHQAPVWSEGKAARPAGNSEFHSTITLCSLQPETPEPPWRSCTEPSWSRRPSERDWGPLGSTQRKKRMSTQRRELSFYQSGTLEPSAPANQDDKDSSPDVSLHEYWPLHVSRDSKL